MVLHFYFFFQAEDGIRDGHVTGVQTCALPIYFQQKQLYKKAIFWYELAINIETDPNKWSFTYPAFATWYPHLQLCVCYYKLKKFKKSYEHNEKAREYMPQDARVLHNKTLLENIV